MPSQDIHACSVSLSQPIRGYSQPSEPLAHRSHNPMELVVPMISMTNAVNAPSQSTNAVSLDMPPTDPPLLRTDEPAASLTTDFTRPIPFDPRSRQQLHIHNDQTAPQQPNFRGLIDSLPSHEAHTLLVKIIEWLLLRCYPGANILDLDKVIASTLSGTPLPYHDVHTLHNST